MRHARPEDVVQRSVIAHLKARGVANLLWFHVPMGGRRNRTEAAILKGLGAVAGIPDLIVIHDGKVFGLELKTESGKVSPAQREMIDRIRACGGFAEIAHGIDAAIATLENWQLLRGKAS